MITKMNLFLSEVADLPNDFRMNPRHARSSRASSIAFISILLIGSILLGGCSTPTLLQVTRRRQADATGYGENDVRLQYHVTDLDVLNFTDEVKRKLARRSAFHMGVRYGSAGTQATLGALAGAAKVIGWGVSTSSGFGLGATYIFGLGQIFDAKAHAQAYEQAFTAIQSAEANFYFHQAGMHFLEQPAGSGKFVVDPAPVPETSGRDIPRSDRLTPDGETLYYQCVKNLKVLDDVLAGKIPDLQDLKDAKGDTSTTTTSTAPTKH